jgi:hypothetical protein
MIVAACGALVASIEDHKKSCVKCVKPKRDEQRVEAQSENNLETYSCPFCPDETMKRHLLLQHMRAHANLAGSCPVCVAPSGGGKPYYSKNLYGHLMLRHKTDTPQIPMTILREQQHLQELEAT